MATVAVTVLVESGGTASLTAVGSGLVAVALVTRSAADFWTWSRASAGLAGSGGTTRASPTGRPGTVAGTGTGGAGSRASSDFTAACRSASCFCRAAGSGAAEVAEVTSLVIWPRTSPSEPSTARFLAGSGTAGRSTPPGGFTGRSTGGCTGRSGAGGTIGGSGRGRARGRMVVAAAVSAALATVTDVAVTVARPRVAVSTTAVQVARMGCASSQ
ncbi:hypothetical protein ASE03_18675 [Kitasatospora sp. Root187]|nr:hypothetical protein ASE03_18675 [Kitasatospora sp. Root187]